MANAVMRRTHVDWDEIYDLQPEVMAELERFLETYEEEHSIDLTPGGIEILFVPLVEELKRGVKIDTAQVANSFSSIIAEAALQPDLRDAESNRRSSFSILRSIWKNWCDIPPLCGPTS